MVSPWSCYGTLSPSPSPSNSTPACTCCLSSPTSDLSLLLRDVQRFLTRTLPPPEALAFHPPTRSPSTSPVTTSFPQISFTFPVLNSPFQQVKILSILQFPYFVFPFILANFIFSFHVNFPQRPHPLDTQYLDHFLLYFSPSKRTRILYQLWGRWSESDQPHSWPCHLPLRNLPEATVVHTGLIDSPSSKLCRWCWGRHQHST